MIDQLERRLNQVEQRARVAEEEADDVGERVSKAIEHREQQRASARTKLQLYRESLEQRDDPEGN